MGSPQQTPAPSAMAQLPLYDPGMKDGDALTEVARLEAAIRADTMSGARLSAAGWDMMMNVSFPLFLPDAMANAVCCLVGICRCGGPLLGKRLRELMGGFRTS